MSAMFNGCCFNGKISQWNTGNVRRMDWMFKDSQFNGDIGNWNTSKALFTNGIMLTAKME
jgi:hypothetical protein